ncbi:hypothetical protein JRQ81_010170 [Phrynocephalus forsythii]|uniref:Uncharacterized protein n=1 Tax=Phrynocephalus forsythii TaxID=171643 RepID=A0A9Q1AR28_9SAUR|nr:hypothetical protein JRQ81_010170 [Phrynocephalus forsythii]
MLTFPNLSPGQYYFKPMMKEFRFEPSSQMIEVQEGQNLKITIIGYRTAYSSPITGRSRRLKTGNTEKPKKGPQEQTK